MSAILVSPILLLDHEMFRPEAFLDTFTFLERHRRPVHYRQYYPNLTHQDFQDYRAIAILGGESPEVSASQMSIADIGPAADFVRQGGLLVLGVSSGENEVYVFNTLLAELGADIAFGEDWIADPSCSALGTMRRYPYYEPLPDHPVSAGIERRIPGGLARPLTLGPSVLALLSSTPTAYLVPIKGNSMASFSDPSSSEVQSGPFPVMALSGVGEGYVLATSRHLLDCSGFSWRVPWRPFLAPHQVERTQRFLCNVFDYVDDLRDGKIPWPFGPSEPCTRTVPEKPSFALNTTPPSRVLPANVRITKDFVLPPKKPTRLFRSRVRPDLYAWIEGEGIRAGWGYIDKSEAHLELLTERLRQAGVNLFWGVASPQRLVQKDVSEADKQALRRQWDWTYERVERAGIHWFMGTHYPGLTDFSAYDLSAGAQGQPSNGPTALDTAFWREQIIEPAQIAAAYSLERPAIKGILCDVEMYHVKPSLYFTNGDGFDDYTYRKFLAHAEGYLSTRELDDIRSLPLTERLEGLKIRGLLDRYFWFLDSEAEKIGRLYRESIDAINPDLIHGFYAQDMVPTWFYWGFWRGVSTPEKPCLFLTFQLHVRRFAEMLARAGIDGYYTVALLMGVVPREDYPQLFRYIAAEEDGYWLNRVSWLVETGSGEGIEEPERMHMTKEEIVECLAAANRQYGDDLRKR